MLIIPVCERTMEISGRRTACPSGGFSSTGEKRTGLASPSDANASCGFPSSLTSRRAGLKFHPHRFGSSKPSPNSQSSLPHAVSSSNLITTVMVTAKLPFCVILHALVILSSDVQLHILPFFSWIVGFLETPSFQTFII